MININDEINRAKWTMVDGDLASAVIERTFSLKGCTEAEIAIAALGFLKLYVNGRRVGDAYVDTLHSLYHGIEFDKMEYPIHDKFTFRAYYSVFDLTDYLTDGENTLEIHLANGFYRQTERIAEGDWRYGDCLGTRYAIRIHDIDGERVIYSDCTELARDSAIRYSELFIGEVYDARIAASGAYKYYPTHEKQFPDTLLTRADAPLDHKVCELAPVLISESDGQKLYDTGINVSGIVRIRAFAKDGERVTVRFAENLKDGELDFETTGSRSVCRSGRQQIMEDVFIGDGEEHIYEPSFVWHAFRYFEIEGDAVADAVVVIHSHADVTSSFTSSSGELNWLYNAFIRTQLNNMHLGFPSDCPHRERLGYTGDGSVCSLAAMTLIDSKNFYRKWIRDIFDSQDKIGGHVAHTAPFAGGGGGPVGWGGAAITVPYNYYKTFGDKSPLYEHYEGMKRYVDYILSRSLGGLVMREDEGGWVLGDWCTLDECVIPAPFVNTALFVKCLEYMKEISAALDRRDDAERFDRIRAEISHALWEKYIDTATGDFADGVQGANAYAIYASLADERAKLRLIEKYGTLGHFDTGFIGTYVLAGLLFDIGARNVAFDLMTSHEPGGFGYMMDRDATTLWEYWRGEGSHDHPMFGASAFYLFSHILGITQQDNTYGYRQVLIRPKIPDMLTYAGGSIMTPKGEICVAFERTDSGVDFTIKLPDGMSADFEYEDRKEKLTKCLNHVSV